jgi:hypothetical protein
MSDSKQSEPSRFRVLNTLHVDVSAKHCLWFAWANDGISGPHGEGEDSRPNYVTIDPDVEFVNIRVTNPENIWWHGSQPDERSTAAGRSKVQGLVNDDYKNNPAYNSSQIVAIETNLNKLLALVGTDTGPVFPYSPEEIGLGRDEVPIPFPGSGEPVTRLLFFGMHDAFEWTNNDSEEMMHVEVDLLRKKD